ncbi:MAG: hypothetical protein VKN72_20445 [Nostocales cyanobacterium 94392]|nr:hypothetical protein [Nostocales cyanobacterium 94392]
MFKEQRKIKNWKTLLSGLAIVIPFLPLTVFAVPARRNPKRNPCPKIYYEEPYNSKLIVPAECTPNAATMRWNQTGQAVDQSINVVPRTTNVRPIQPPAPEARQSAIATVKPMMDGRVSVTLKNDTNARISYQVITHTQTRILPATEEVVLREIPTPATITLVREDAGWLKVMPISTEDGMLTLSLDEETTLDDNQGVIRIQKDGQVFLN